MYDYLVFDLDGTLAPIGKPASKETVDMLHALEDEGKTICLCSGKPAYYLCGFARQGGLKKPVLIGENGGMILCGLDLPPKEHYTVPFAHEKARRLETIRKDLADLLRDHVWFQPNSFAVTPFLQCADDFDAVDRYISDHRELFDGLRVYKQCDCYDILPEEFSKEIGLRYFAERRGVSSGQFVAVGDGINDLSMFCFAGLSIGIGKALEGKTDIIFETIEEALRYIITID